MVDDTLYGTRSAKGEWSPSHSVDYSPIFHWPLRPVRIARWFAGPRATCSRATRSTSSWRSPSGSSPRRRAARCRRCRHRMDRRAPRTQLRVGDRRLVRPVPAAALPAARAGHQFKYNAKFPAAQSGRFTFGSQTQRERVLGVGERRADLDRVGGRDAVADRHAAHPVAVSWTSTRCGSSCCCCVIPLWREVHFYAIHRLIHWPPLYQAVHSLHHRNTNPGPWSGLSMHPVEHLLYFSAVRDPLGRARRTRSTRCTPRPPHDGAGAGPQRVRPHRGRAASGPIDTGCLPTTCTTSTSR